MNNDAFVLAERSDIVALRASFAANARIEIPLLLPAAQAAALRTHLMARDDWLTVINAGEQAYEIPRATLQGMAAEQRAGLEQRVHGAARDGFQYRFESIRVPDSRGGRDAAPSLLTRFVDFMGSGKVRVLIAAITGIDDVVYADGQATAYSAGDFLTRHDDDVEGKARRAAYVFGLAPDWRAEWGGLLMFHGADGNIVEGFVPAMGALRLFAVPAVHSVSYVAPFAPEPRLAVTGWLRASPQPD